MWPAIFVPPAWLPSEAYGARLRAWVASPTGPRHLLIQLPSNRRSRENPDGMRYITKSHWGELLELAMEGLHRSDLVARLRQVSQPGRVGMSLGAARVRVASPDFRSAVVERTSQRLLGKLADRPARPAGAEELASLHQLLERLQPRSAGTQPIPCEVLEGELADQDGNRLIECDTANRAAEKDAGLSGMQGVDELADQVRSDLRASLHRAGDPAAGGGPAQVRQWLEQLKAIEDPALPPPAIQPEPLPIAALDLSATEYREARAGIGGSAKLGLGVGGLAGLATTLVPGLGLVAAPLVGLTGFGAFVGIAARKWYRARETHQQKVAEGSRALMAVAEQRRSSPGGDGALETWAPIRALIDGDLRTEAELYLDRMAAAAAVELEPLPEVESGELDRSLAVGADLPGQVDGELWADIEVGDAFWAGSGAKVLDHLKGLVDSSALEALDFDQPSSVVERQSGEDGVAALKAELQSQAHPWFPQPLSDGWFVLDWTEPDGWFKLSLAHSIRIEEIQMLGPVRERVVETTIQAALVGSSDVPSD